MAWVIPIASAIIGGIGQSSQNRAQRAAYEEMIKNFERAAKQFKPGKILRRTARFQRGIGNQLQARLGETLSSGLNADLARRGLTGTGLGTALKSAIRAVPGQMAFDRSFNAALTSSQGIANAYLAAGGIQPPVQKSPLLTGLQSGLGSATFLGGQGVNLMQPLTREAQPDLFTQPRNSNG